MAASPTAVAERVSVPVLLTGGLRDPRCPIDQIDADVKHLAELGKPCELHVADRGHAVRVTIERVEELATIFALRRPSPRSPLSTAPELTRNSAKVGPDRSAMSARWEHSAAAGRCRQHE